MAYFSFDNDKDRRPIAVIKGGKADGKLIYLGQDNEDEDYDIENKKCCDNCFRGCGIDFPRCCKNCKGNCHVIPDKKEGGMAPYERLFGKEILKVQAGKFPFINIRDGVMIPIPIKKNAKEEKRENIFITGPEGSGKSTWAANYSKEFKKLYPNSKLFIFSKVKSDKPLDDLNPIRININEELIDNPMTTNEFPYDSLVIFDDIDTIANEKLRKEVVKLRDRLLEDGRHRGIFVLSLTHNPTCGKDTKMSLLESSSIVMFPQGGDSYHMERVLKAYLSYMPKNIKSILNLNTRWIQCHKRFPRFILHEKGCFLP
jgi:hypothetical protein